MIPNPTSEHFPLHNDFFRGNKPPNGPSKRHNAPFGWVNSMKELNDKLSQDSRITISMQNIGDGLSIVLKK